MTFQETPIDRRIARRAKHLAKAAKRIARREARRDRPKGQGAPVDWSLSTTVPPEQFLSAFPNTRGLSYAEDQ